MKLYLISQSANTGYDTFDSAVIAAKNERDAQHTHPSTMFNIKWRDDYAEPRWMGVREDGSVWNCGNGDWTDPANVTVELIGTAKPGTSPGAICASFNAG